MLQVFFIVIFACLAMRDYGPANPVGLRTFSDGTILWLVLVPMVVLALFTHIGAVIAARSIDSTGTFRSLRWSDRSLNVSRWAAMGLHGVNVFVLGWLDVVRNALGPIFHGSRWDFYRAHPPHVGMYGDVILLDELIAASPALLLIVIGWWSVFPVERRLRESVLLNSLDHGRAVYSPLTRFQFIALNVRHQLLLVVPLVLLLTWTELCDVGVAWLHERANHPPASPVFPIDTFATMARDPNDASLLHGGAQLLGVLAVFSLLPLAISIMWNTSPLEPGALRDRLMRLCERSRVRVRGLLVWRTSGTMVNGAVLGLIPWTRYILLTDALLDALSEDEIEAVMAHEVAHVRKRHIPWLAAAMIVSASALGAAAEFGVRAMGIPLDGRGASATAVLGVMAFSLAGGLVVLGFVSRRFEWQADAFAAVQLSGGPGPDGQPPSDHVTPQSVNAMAGALDSVARLNHIPTMKFSFRHGSIHRRITNLTGLIGRPHAALPIDRTVRRIKWAALVGLVVLAGVLAWQVLAARQPARVAQFPAPSNDPPCVS